VYVEGDPVNLSDPTGLQSEGDEPPGMMPLIFFCKAFPGHPACIDLPAGNASPFRGHLDLATGLRDRVREGEINECEALALFAEDAVRQNSNTATAVAWFEAITPVNPLAAVLNATATVNARTDAVTLGSYSNNARNNGFSAEFKDGALLTSRGWVGGSNHDQSHHFAAFFQLGFFTGSEFVGELAARVFDPMNPGDVNLGKAAASIGARLAQRRIVPGELGNMIRREICSTRTTISSGGR
jgi:hypothetical protein